MTEQAGEPTRMNHLEAQQRADAIRSFRAELQALQSEGVAVDPAWAAAVQRHHDALLATLQARWNVDTTEATRRLSLGMRIVSFLGALALAAAVYFLYDNFWGQLSTPVQVGTLLGGSLGSLWLCFVVRARDASGYFTKLAALLALVCFIINVFLLGQLFNLPSSDRALLLWAGLGFLLAYACNARLLLVAAICCVTAFIAARVGTWGGLYWLDLGERPENFFPAALLLFLLPQVIDQRRFGGFAQTYRISGLLCLLMPMLLLSNWAWGSYLPGTAKQVNYFYQLACFVCSGAVIWLGIRRGWPEVMHTGVVFFTIFIYTRFFDWWWDVLPDYLFFLLLALIAVLLLLVFTRMRHSATHRAGHRA